MKKVMSFLILAAAAGVDSPAHANEVAGEHIDFWNSTHANEETGEIPDARAAACRRRQVAAAAGHERKGLAALHVDARPEAGGTRMPG